MSHLTPEERVEFDLQLDALREKRQPGYITVGAGKRWSVIWKGSSVLLTPLAPKEPEISPDEPPPLPF